VFVLGAAPLGRREGGGRPGRSGWGRAADGPVQVRSQVPQAPSCPAPRGYFTPVFGCGVCRWPPGGGGAVPLPQPSQGGGFLMSLLPDPPPMRCHRRESVSRHRGLRPRPRPVARGPGPRARCQGEGATDHPQPLQPHHGPPTGVAPSLGLTASPPCFTSLALARKRPDSPEATHSTSPPPPVKREGSPDNPPPTVSGLDPPPPLTRLEAGSPLPNPEPPRRQRHGGLPGSPPPGR